MRLFSHIIICSKHCTDLAKIHHGKSSLVLCAVHLTAFHIGIADHSSKLCPVHLRIICKGLDPSCVIPAVSRLCFLACHHIAGNIGKSIGGIHSRHQTGIKSHQFQGRIFLRQFINRIKGVINFCQGKGIIAIQLIKSHAASTSASVIPENHCRMLCRIIVPAKFQEVCQRAALSHIGRIQLLHTLKAFTAVHIPFQIIRFHRLILPLAASACFYNNFHIFRKFCFHQLTKILCSTSIIAFQITAAQVPVDGPVIRFLGLYCLYSLHISKERPLWCKCQCPG